MPSYSQKAIDYVWRLFERRRPVSEGEELFFFFCLNLPGDTFSVVRFEGEERLNQLYRFEFILVSEKPDVDVDATLMSPVIFVYMRGPDQGVPLHGMIMEFEQMHEAQGQYYYRAVMAPKLWLLTQIRHNQVFLNKTIPDVLKQILTEGGLTSLSYQFKLQGNYDQEHEYICQYGETHFDFFTRWLERMGLYFYFEVTSEGEKVIITDSMLAHEPHVRGDGVIPFVPPSMVPEKRQAVIQKFNMRQQRLPSEVMLKDYNYRRPTMELGAWTTTNAEGGGRIYAYGEHFQTPDEGLFFARIQAQEIGCRYKTFHGESTAPYLRPGFTFKLKNHFRDSFNAEYLTTGIKHEGAQALPFVSGVRRESPPQQHDSFYRNSFSAIPRDVQYRPPREQPRPRFYGTLNAHIDASGSGQYAEVDEQGRYKVILPFDLSGRKGGKASSWLRMSQPYVGAGHGMHFPLHKGAEVLLSFIEGNPDRPIITGAVPNPVSAGVMHSLNQTRGGFQTGGGNTLLVEDKKGKERMLLRSGDKGSQISFGAGSPSEIFLGTSFKNEIASFASTQSAGYIGQLMSMFKFCSMTGFRKLQLLLKSLDRLVEMAPELVALVATGTGEAESKELEERNTELEAEQEALAEKKAELDKMDAAIHDLENEIKTLSDIISFMQSQNSQNPSQDRSTEIAAAQSKLDELKRQLEEKKLQRNKLALQIKTEKERLTAEGKTLQDDAEAVTQKYDEIAGITKMVAPAGILIASLLIKLFETKRVEAKIKELTHQATIVGEPAIVIANMKDGNIFHMASPMVPGPNKNKDIAIMSEDGQVQIYANKQFVTTSGGTTQIFAPNVQINSHKIDLNGQIQAPLVTPTEINLNSNQGSINLTSLAGNTNITSDSAMTLDTGNINIISKNGGNIKLQCQGAGDITIGPDKANVDCTTKVSSTQMLELSSFCDAAATWSTVTMENTGKYIVDTTNDLSLTSTTKVTLSNGTSSIEINANQIKATHPTSIDLNDLKITPTELTYKGTKVTLG
jgi:type VI secretion system VgrG family protein